MKPIRFYCVDTTKDTVSVKLSDFDTYGPAPILWSYQGMFSIIPEEVVKNVFDLLTDVEKVDAVHSFSTKKNYTFHWDDTTSMVSFVRLLFNERP